MSAFTLAGQVCWDNCTDVPLAAGATFTGNLYDVSKFASLVVSCKTSQAGSMYVDFSVDGTNWDSTLTFTVTADTNEVHRLTVSKKFARVRFTNSSASPQTYIRLQTLMGSGNLLTSSLSSTLQTDADAVVTRGVLVGQTDSGSYVNVPVTESGHLEVAIHDPTLPFGSLHTESLFPIFQTDAVYGLNLGQVYYGSSLTGSVTGTGSIFSCSTGTTAASQAFLQSRKRLRYRPGQGVVARFTGVFTTPVASSYQVIGVGHAEDGVFFGYKGTEFGVIYNKNGVREVQTLTVTVASSHTENVVVTLADTAFNIAVTNSGNIQRTVYEIASGTYTGWKAEARGATVVFVADAVGNKTGAFTLAGTSATGTFAETLAGAAVSETFVAQADWNGDRLDGTGASGVTIDPTKGNVFQIGIQYLGFGTLVFKVEVAPSNSNNATFATAHSIKLPNTLTAPSFGNPSFPFSMATYSAGSTTNLTAKCASFAGFIEGEKRLHGNRFTYFNQLTTVGATNLQALFTVFNTRYYGGRSNQAVINLLNVSGALKHNSPCIFYLIKNGTLAGNPNFTSLSSNSCSYWDTAATTVTYSTGDQLVATFHLGDTGNFDHRLYDVNEEITLQPGEWITLAARSTVASPSYVTGSINTREDQ